MPTNYSDFLTALKNRVRTSQVQAALAINQALVRLYWQIGRDIEERQRSEGWGADVINRLARDLKAAFPDMAGFSPRNLRYMRDFARAWPDESIWQPAVAKLPWSHNLRLLDKLSDRDMRLWYAEQAVMHGWSRAILQHQIESNLYGRQGQAVTNFTRTLPPPQSDLARQVLKDPITLIF